MNKSTRPHLIVAFAFNQCLISKLLLQLLGYTFCINHFKTFHLDMQIDRKKIYDCHKKVDLYRSQLLIIKKARQSVLEALLVQHQEIFLGSHFHLITKK